MKHTSLRDISIRLRESEDKTENLRAIESGSRKKIDELEAESEAVYTRYEQENYRLLEAESNIRQLQEKVSSYERKEEMLNHNLRAQDANTARLKDYHKEAIEMEQSRSFHALQLAENAAVLAKDELTRAQDDIAELEKELSLSDKIREQVSDDAIKCKVTALANDINDWAYDAFLQEIGRQRVIRHLA